MVKFLFELMCFFIVDGLVLLVEMCYLVGDLVLLFVYGFGQMCGVWVVSVDVFVGVGCCCVSFDSCGYGESDWLFDGQYYMDQFVIDLIIVVFVQFWQLVLVGVLMGGLFGLVVVGEMWLILFCVLVLVDIILCWEIVGVECIFVFMQVYLDGFVDYVYVVEVIVVYLLQCCECKS